jgi:hypothetical protein
VTADKAVAAFLWGLVPVVLGAVIVVLQNATTLLAGAPTWVFTAATVLLIVLAPAASYVGTYLTPNKLKVPVRVLMPAGVVADTTGEAPAL